MNAESENKAGQAAALLAWYDGNRRILPWREDPAPFHVWLSEIMLQQTRVEAVKGYYTRFLEALPDIPSLADAEEEDLLKLWEGLGYYSRVRNLHRAAQIIVRELGGSMPETAEELRKLPGIGDYTAAAVASIAFGKTAAAVDGNLLRVFSRMTMDPEEMKAPAAKKKAEAYFLSLMEEAGSGTERNIPGDINQALMDLGATVCLPSGTPLCEECPWNALCRAHESGRETDFPVIPEKKARKIEKKTVLIIRYDGRTVLRQRPKKGLLAGMYEFPNEEGTLSEKEALLAARKLGFQAVRIRPLPESRHIFTHREWHMSAFEIFADELLEAPGAPLILAAEEEIREKYAIPTAFSKYRSCVLQNPV